MGTCSYWQMHCVVLVCKLWRKYKDVSRCICIKSLCWSEVNQIRSDQISRSVVSDSLQPHESQHARPPCPSPTPGVHSDSSPWSRWCHPAISSSVVPFSSCPQSLPASESFPLSQLFAWVGQSTGVSALASFLPKKSQGWPPSEGTGGSDSKASAYNAGDLVSIPGSGRSSGEANGIPLQYSCLENTMDGGAW